MLFSHDDAKASSGLCGRCDNWLSTTIDALYRSLDQKMNGKNGIQNSYLSPAAEKATENGTNLPLGPRDLPNKSATATWQKCGRNCSDDEWQNPANGQR